MKKKVQIMLMSFIVMAIASNIFASTGDTVRIQVSEFPPCVIVNDDGTIDGFDIEIWNEISASLNKKWKDGITYSMEVVNPHTKILENLENGQADIGIASFTITSDRERKVDFSHHYLDSGLRILVLKKSPTLFDKFIVFWEAIDAPAMLFLLFLFIFAHVIWYLEKDDNPDNDVNGINDNYFPGIFEAIYFCIVTCSTVGYGDYTPKKWPGRIIVIALIFAGIIAFCNFTALLSSEYTTEKIASIKSVEDLKGKTVITQKDTPATHELEKLGAKVKEVDTISQACDWLLLERGDALVFDSPIIMEYAKQYPDKVEVVGDVFAKQYYGFALQKDSPLREDINEQLLKLRESGEYQKIYNKWFKK
jgi:ABC-type amino acid transport substrate-binding protein